MGDSDIEKKVKPLRDWINTQPHLPQDLEDRILLRFLHSCYYDLEKTQTCIELFFTIRANSPELLTKRDPESKEIQKFFKIVNMSCIKIAGKRNLWIWQLNDPGLEVYDYLMDAKVFFMATDVWILKDDQLQEEDIVLMDVKDISLKFITKFNVSIARKLGKYQEEAMPIRLKQVHIVNCPSFIDKLHGLMKPFIKQEVQDLIHFHKPNSDTLFKYLKKDELPEDYGGTCPKMSDLMTKTLEDFSKYRDFFVKDNAWIADDSKRVKGSKKKQASKSPAVENFRSLAID